MKAYCPLCKTEGHWGSNCPKLKSLSHGAPRACAHDLVAPEHVPRRRRPLVPTPAAEAIQAHKAIHVPLAASSAAAPHAAAPHPPPTATDPTSTQPSPPSHNADMHTASHPPVTEIQPISVTPVTRKRGRPKSGNALTPAQKQAAYRARKSQKGGTPK